MGTWTDKKIEKLKQLWEKGVPTAEIGKRLDFSKNAIVGKVHRLGLSNRNSPIKTSSNKVEKVKKNTSKKVEEVVSTSVKKAKVTPVKTPVSKVETKEKFEKTKNESQKTSLKQSKKAVLEGVSLSELTFDRCCWPLDDANSDEFRFCGKKVFKNRPYCLEHCAMAYTTSSSSTSKNTAVDKNKTEE